MNTGRTPLAVLCACCLRCRAATKPNPHADLDCNYCHLDTPRFGVDTRETVNFWRAEGDEPQLCERCHGPETNFHPLGVVPGPERLGTRRPSTSRSARARRCAARWSASAATSSTPRTPTARCCAASPGPTSPACSRLAGSLPRVPRRRAGEALAARRGRPRLRLLPLDQAQARPAGDGHPGGAQALRVLPRLQGRGALRRRQPLPGAAGVHGVPRPAPGQGPPRPPEARLFRPDPRHGHAQPPPQAHPLLRLPRRGKPGPLRGADAVALCQRCHGSGKIPGMSHPMTKVPPAMRSPRGGRSPTGR